MPLPTNSPSSTLNTLPPVQARPVRRRVKRRVRTLSVLLLVLIAGVILLTNLQNIQDYSRLRNYHAPVTIAQLAAQDTMTPYANKVFYVNHPDVEVKALFAKNCPNNGGEQTIVLGCYHSNQQGIFLLDVSDARLNGVEQVTAAHETLHAIYDRLSTGQRNNVDRMLMDYYQHDLTDPRIKSTIAAYKRTEPHDVVNEMHSVFGTEVPNLPPALETYYKQYFTNRAAITEYAAAYQAEFTSRQAQVAQDDMQLAALKQQIDSQQSDLDSKLKAINSAQATLQQQKNSGNISAYNSGVTPFNALVDGYNNEVDSLKHLIDQYNTLVNSRNAIALEEQQLQNDLTASPQQLN